MSQKGFLPSQNLMFYIIYFIDSFEMSTKKSDVMDAFPADPTGDSR